MSEDAVSAAEIARKRVPEKEHDQRKAFLQLRWETYREGEDKGDGEDDPIFCGRWLCHYELVIPLGRWDIRREDDNYNVYRDEIVLAIKPPTVRSSDNEPCRQAGGVYYYDLPYRDGAHAGWDAALLGNLEIVAIACDGTVIRKPDEVAR